MLRSACTELKTVHNLNISSTTRPDLTIMRDLSYLRKSKQKNLIENNVFSHKKLIPSYRAKLSKKSKFTDLDSIEETRKIFNINQKYIIQNPFALSCIQTTSPIIIENIYSIFINLLIL